MLNSMQGRATVRVPQGRLFSVLLLSLLLIVFAFLGSWFLTTQVLVKPAPQVVLPPERTPLISSLLNQKAIVWSIAFSALAMVSALLAATSPLLWWSRLLILQKKLSGAGPAEIAVWEQEQRLTEEWLAAQEAMQQVAQFQGTLATQSDAPSMTLNQPSPGAAPLSGQFQQTGQQPQIQRPEPGQQQAHGPSQPAQTIEGQQPPTQQVTQPLPGQPQPNGQQPQNQQQAQTALQLLQAQEDVLDLEDITNIGDILNTFADHDAVPAHLLALSQSLDDIDVTTLATGVKSVAHHLIAGIERRASM